MKRTVVETAFPGRDGVMVIMMVRGGKIIIYNFCGAGEGGNYNFSAPRRRENYNFWIFRWICSMDLLDGPARWVCSRNLLDGCARWICSMTLRDGSVRWICSKNSKNFSWRCARPGNYNFDALFDGSARKSQTFLQRFARLCSMGLLD